MNGTLQIFSGVLHCHTTHCRCHSLAVSSPACMAVDSEGEWLGLDASLQGGAEQCALL